MTDHTQGSCEAWASPDHVEWQMIRGIVPPDSASATMCRKVVVGEFSDVLKSRAARPLFEVIAKVVHTTVQGKTSSEQVIIPFSAVHIPVSESPGFIVCCHRSLARFCSTQLDGP